MTTVIVNPDRRRIALMTLRARLRLEVRFGGGPAFTLQAARGWGFKGRTRKQALAWVEREMEAYE